MAKLIVDDAGARKAFRLPKGRLTVGSDEGNTLRLVSEGVAARHLEIATTDTSSVVRVPADGAPVQLGGRTLAPGGQGEWAPGTELKVGGAVLRLEAEGVAAAPAPARGAPAAPARAGATAGRAGASARSGGGRTSAARTGGGRAAGGSRRRGGAGDTDEQGRPKWLMPAVGIVLVVIVGAVYALFIHDTDRARYFVTDVAAVETHLESQNYELARRAYDPLAASTKLDAAQRAKVDELGRKLAAGESLRTGGGVLVTQGHAWKGRYLDAFVTTHFAEEPYATGAVRVFADRVADFREFFPGHPADAELAAILTKVKASEVRAQPLTLADVEFYEHYHTDRVKSPKRFPLALAVMDQFLAKNPSGAEHDAVVAKRDARLAEQRTVTLALIEKAQKAWSETNEGGAVAALAEAVAYVAGGDLATQAAATFAALPNARAYLVDYRTKDPELFRGLMTQPALQSLVGSDS